MKPFYPSLPKIVHEVPFLTKSAPAKEMVGTTESLKWTSPLERLVELNQFRFEDVKPRKLDTHEFNRGGN
jgi:hypothetical protein